MLSSKLYLDLSNNKEEEDEWVTVVNEETIREKEKLFLLSETMRRS